MTIYDQTGKIVEKKFYHSEWKITDLLKARNDGLLTDEGEAWKYRYSHMDGTGGKYDLLFRREPAAIEAPAREPVQVREAGAYTARGIADLNMLVHNLSQQGFRIIAVIDTQNGDYHVVAQKDGSK